MHHQHVQCPTSDGHYKHRVGACRDLAKIRAVDDDSKRTGACYEAFD